MDKKQGTQESQYSFPYHYINELGDRFSFSKVMRWGHVYVSYIEKVIQIIESKQAESVVEIGCGDGRFLYELRKRNPQIKLSGADYSEKAIGYARAFNGDGVDFYACNIIDDSSGIGKFDAAVLIETLEHIPPDERDRFVAAVAGLIKSGGSLVVTVPHANLPVQSKHYEHFTLETLNNVLQEYFCTENYYHLNKTSKIEKITNKVMANRYYVITSRALSKLYLKMYKKFFMEASEKNASRLCVVYRKK